MRLCILLGDISLLPARGLSGRWSGIRGGCAGRGGGSDGWGAWPPGGCPGRPLFGASGAAASPGEASPPAPGAPAPRTVSSSLMPSARRMLFRRASCCWIECLSSINRSCSSANCRCRVSRLGGCSSIGAFVFARTGLPHNSRHAHVTARSGPHGAFFMAMSPVESALSTKSGWALHDSPGWLYCGITIGERA